MKAAVFKRNLVPSVVGLDDFPNKFEAMRTPSADLKVMLEPGLGTDNL